MGGIMAAQEHINLRERPNVILVMCDDLGWGDVGFNGSSTIKTPNLDEMAGAGIIFSRFYSAAPVCSPTRASCLTGRNPFRMGIYSANVGHMRSEEITLAEVLSKAGYSTGHFGKWHLGTLTTALNDANRGMPGDSSHLSRPTDHGYHEYFCTESKVPTWDPMLKPTSFQEESGSSLRYGWPALLDGEKSENYGTFYWSGPDQMELNNLRGDNSEVIMDRAIPFIERSVKRDQPFFTTIWLHTPHLPVVTHKAYRDLYPKHDLSEQLYYGCISAMDEQIGRLWSTLQKLNVSEHTMLWFCSDNGPERQTPGSAGSLRARKRSLYEGGVRVPAFCLWPDNWSSGTADVPAVTSDYLPTILDILQIEYPETDRPLDGITLRKLLDGKTKQRRSPIGFQSTGGKRSWVEDRYKLISPEGENFELYDLISDRTESNNIAAKHPAKVDSMKHALLKWIEDCTRSDQGGDYEGEVVTPNLRH
ncbi:MAG: sulfatase-like hydrolase/transferase [Saprospiraceae bacterium]|nr:sulfatase-like hydrolase/transferase [Saprospiraceae bacterium]